MLIVISAKGMAQNPPDHDTHVAVGKYISFKNYAANGRCNLLAS